MARERRRNPDLDERFKIETDGDPEDALRRLLGVEVPIDETGDMPEDEDS
jgi:hypothetical protein